MPSRIALANWITDVDHGAGHLLARVIVNRLWQHHLGDGIVGTPNDFGIQGEPPTHPELLDYLARELINNGWKLKPIHKLIMTSAVYMQAGECDPGQYEGRSAKPPAGGEGPCVVSRPRPSAMPFSPSAGTLDLKMYGPGSLDGNNPRRSIYLTVKHSHKIPLLQMFDFPDAAQSIGERSVTTRAAAIAGFHEFAFVRQAAGNIAKPHSREFDGRKQGNDRLAYLTVLSRRPTSQERSRWKHFCNGRRKVMAVRLRHGSWPLPIAVRCCCV